jgi:transcriptional regulator with XRE-family HTH domain
MAFRTTAVEAAEARGWSKAELHRRTGLSLRTIYLLEQGKQPGPKAIEGIMSAFPGLPYERLFVPIDSSALKSGTTVVQPVAAETDTENVPA